jgi:hypothetical protein
MRFPLLLRAVPILVSLFMAPVGAASPEPVRCEAQEVEYTLTARLYVADTPMGAGDGTYEVGPGRLVLRIDGGDSRSARVELRSYEMRERFAVVSRAAFWKTTVVTDAVGAAGPAAQAVADGTLSGSTLTWTSQVRGYRTDGTLDCTGDMCGSFGAPPAGQSRITPPPGVVKLTPFRFSPDSKTFTMDHALLSSSSSPKQRTFISISGREVGRTCLAPRR